MRTYKISVIGESFRTDDLTLDDAAWIEGETEQSWLVLDPVLSAKALKAIAIRWLITRGGRAEGEARKVVGELKLDGLLEMIEVVEDDTPGVYNDGIPDPKASSEPATNGSSGSSTNAAGSPTKRVASPSVT